MRRIISQSSVCAVVSMSVLLFLQSTAGGETKSKPMGLSTNSKGMPFWQSEAEKWSFQNQTQKSFSQYLKRVESVAKESMRIRYKFNRTAKIPDYFTDLSSKVPSIGRMNESIHFFNGWANGFPNINLVGQTTAMFEESTIIFHCDVNLWKHLVLVYEYIILENCREFKGHANVDIKDARYSLEIAFDIPTKGVELLSFGRKSNRLNVSVDGLEGNNRLAASLLPVLTDFYRGTVFPDMETVMHTILEDSLRITDVSLFLPKADYKKEHPGPQVEEGGLEICDTDSETELGEDSLPWVTVTEIPFILNTGEMWAFQKQMENGLNQLMGEVSFKTTQHLAERELLRAKLADDNFLMNIKDQTSTSRHAPMLLRGGWFSSQFKFNLSGIGEVEFHDRDVDFTAYFHLEDPMEFVHDFEATYLRNKYEGDIRGRVKFLEYALKFSLDLETAVLTLKDPKLDCAREISIEVTGLESQGEWFSSELKRNILRRFRESTLLQIHTVLSNAFYFVTSAETAGQFLPKWNYARDFRTDFDFRIGEQDEDSVETCDAQRIQKLQERSQRFSELVAEDGAFNDSTPDAESKYFTHVSGIKNFPIRYTSTKTQSWYFDQDLRFKMNEYMYKLLKTTRDIIRTRGLRKARMLDYKQSATKSGSELRIEKCWIDGLGSVAVTGVDIMEFDQKVITLISNIQVYKDLKFEGEYIILGPGGKRTEGKIVTLLPPVEISLRIEIDYLGEKSAKLDYMKLECIGANSSHSFSNSRVSRVSESVDAHFREVMVEDLFQIFKHAFEDAMAETKWEGFLPLWDYKRDYITEIIQNEKMNRFQIDMDLCNGSDWQKPSLRDFYPEVETMDFSHFLPDIKIVGLRRSFQRQIHVLMEDAVNSMWRNMVKGSLQRFSPPKFHDNGITLTPEGSQGNTVSLIYSVIDFQGLPSEASLDEVDFAYGKEDTLIILYQQSFDSIRVTYNLSLADNPNGEREYGTAVVTAEGLKYLLKVQFFLQNSTLSVDEFFLRCIKNFSVAIEGLRPEREAILDSVKDSLKSSFPTSELTEIKELLYILYGYAAAELNMTLYTYSWTYDRDLYKIAAREEERHGEGEQRPCKDEDKRDGRTVISQEDIPFIGSEAEWWSFSKQTQGQIDRFKKEVRKLAREFIRDHALQESLIPDLEKNFARQTNRESETVICKLTEGTVSNLMSFKYVGNTVVEAGKELKITSFITFDDDLKFRYQLEARSEKESASGRVRSNAKFIIYKMVIIVNTDNKTVNLESFDLKCMRDIEIIARIPKKSFSWVKEMIPDAFREDFTSLVKGDVEKMLEMAFAYGVKNADVAPYLKNWNYRKDYGAMVRRGGPAEETRGRASLSSCRDASNSTNA